MTVLGFKVVAPDCAYLWCDTEVFADSAPSGHALKMAVNAIGACAIVGTGRMSLLRDAADALGSCLSFDEAVSSLPETMCRARRAYLSLELAARSPPLLQVIGLVGFSNRFGRVVGATFDLADDFEPILPRWQYHAPMIDSPTHVADVHSAISVAGEQLAVLQRQLVDASGGALILAEITPGAVRCGPVWDFTTGHLLRRAPDLSTRTAGARGRETCSDKSASAAITPTADGPVAPSGARSAPLHELAALSRRAMVAQRAHTDDRDTVDVRLLGELVARLTRQLRAVEKGQEKLRDGIDFLWHCFDQDQAACECTAANIRGEIEELRRQLAQRPAARERAQRHALRG